MNETTGKKRTGISETVAEIARERRVTERTVWRWVAAVRTSGSDELLAKERNCDNCGRALPGGSTIRRRFCDGVCRVYYHRYREPKTAADDTRLGH